MKIYNTIERPSYGTWIQTWSGQRFDFMAPSADAVFLEDIAHSLSMQCRFNGHCRVFYSVAEHSCIVAGIVLLAKLSKIALPFIGYVPTGDAMADARNLVALLTNFLETSPSLASPVRVFISFARGVCIAKEYPRRALKPLALLWFLRRLDSADRMEVAAALLHDGTEAYAKDLPSPIKAVLPLYKAKEAEIEQVVFARFGLSSHLPLSATIHAADREILFCERDALLRHSLEDWGAGIKRDPQIGIFAEAFAIRGLDANTAESEFMAAASYLGLR